MSEYRVLTDSGDVLVISIRVEAAAVAGPPDAASIGSALLQALGIGGGGNAPSAPVRVRKPAPVEPSAEEWLENTSRAALKRM